MRKVIGLSAVCATLLISGCAANTVGIGVSSVGSTPKADTPNIKRVNSSSLKGKAVITSTKLYVDGALLTAQVGLRSRVTKLLNLQYRFIWFTATGRQLDAGDAWMPIVLYGKDEAYLKATAPDPTAAEFSVDIRFQDK